MAATFVASGPARADPFTFSRLLAPPTATRGAFLGGALATDGATVYAGARFADAGQPQAGAVYAFDAGSGALVATYVAPDGVTGDQFGTAVALVAGTLAVAAPHATAGDAIGVVYLFDPTSATLLGTLPDPTPAANELFGYALAAVGDTLAVGAPFSDLAAPGAGAVHLFDPRTGALLQTLVDPSAGEYDVFGQTLAAVGDRLAVGAPLADDAATNAGAVHVFDVASGALLRSFRSPRAIAGGLFGSAVAAAGGMLVVGAPLDAGTGASAGAVYLFDPDGGTLRGSLVDPAASSDERFGSAVASFGGDVLVGAPLADAAAADAGAVCVYDAASGTFVGTLVEPDAGAGDQFGSALAASSSAVAIGARLRDEGAVDAGAVDVFVPSGVTTTTETTTTTTTTSTTTTTTTSTSSTTTSSTTTSTTADTASTTTTSATDVSSTSTTTSITTTTEDTSSSTSTATSIPDTTAPTSTAGTTSSTTTTSATTTTVATPLPSASCDDRDACTDDGSDADGTCWHVPVTGSAAVVCRLDRLDAMLHAAPATALGGRKLLVRLERIEAQSRRLVVAGAALRRAARILGRFGPLVMQAERRGRMLRALAEGLRATADDAARALAGLARPGRAVR